MDMANLTAQSEELLALRSIYDDKDLLIIEEKPPSGRFLVNVHLPQIFFIRCDTELLVDTGTETAQDISKEVKLEVEYLPPIILFFEFPENYPSDACPKFYLSCNWLDLEKISKLCKKLESIWEEGLGEVVVFSWVNFLQEEALEFLEITKYLDISELSKYNRCLDVNKTNNKCLHNLNDCSQCEAVSDVNNSNDITETCKVTLKNHDSRAVLDLTNGTKLLTIIEEYDTNKKTEIFQNTLFLCKICFIEKKGSSFMKFNKCNHMYCQDCLKSYFEIQIKDGNVHSLNCPEVKCVSQADDTQVKKLINLELYYKYENLLLSRTLENMSDVVYCPRQSCQCPLIADQENKMGCCPACSFVFCLFCRMVYHGIAPCKLKPEEKKNLCNKYLNGTITEKDELERRYGKKALQRLVNDNLSEEWVTSNSKQCPHCHANIEKTEGCNKMTCYRCGTFFCWLCQLELKPQNPYFHFSQRGSPCFEKLFPENYEDDDVFPGQFL